MNTIRNLHQVVLENVSEGDTGQNVISRSYDSGKLKTRKNLISETYYTQRIMTVILTTISDLKKNFYFMNTDKKTW